MLELLREEFVKELSPIYGELLKKEEASIDERFLIAKYETMYSAITELIECKVNSYYAIYPFYKKFRIDFKELKELRESMLRDC